MMEKGKKYILIAPAALIFVFILILRTAVWGEYLQSELNNRIKASGWSVKVEQSSGYLFGTTILSNVNLSHINGPSIGIDKASINIGILSSLIGSPSLDLLTVEGLSLNYANHDYSKDSSKQSLERLNIPFHIRSFFIEGKVQSNIKANKYIFDIMVGGELIGGETPLLNCDLVKISLENNSNMVCKFNTMILGYDDYSYFLKEINGELFGLPVLGNLSLIRKTSILKGAIEALEFSFPEELFSKLPLKTKFSTFTGHFNFESDLENFYGELSVENQ